jgi:hypothetical protein
MTNEHQTPWDVRWFGRPLSDSSDMRWTAAESSWFSLFVPCNLAQVDAWPMPCPSLRRAIWIQDRRKVEIEMENTEYGEVRF